MKKLFGRKLNVKIAAAIMDLEDESFYSIGEVASQVYDKKSSRLWYDKALDSLRKLAKRNDLHAEPDNAIRDDQGKVIFHEDGKNNRKPKLKKGERIPKYCGWRWKGILYDSDREAGLKTPLERPALQKHVLAILHRLDTKIIPLLGQWRPVPLKETIPKQENASVPVMRFSTRTKRAVAWGFGTCVAALMLTAMATIARYGADEIIEMYLAKGPKAALAMALSAKDAGLEQYFALGWLYYQEDKYQRAKKVMTDLRGHRLPLRLETKVYYALGLLDIQIEHFESAVLYLNLAERNYYSLGDQRGVHVVKMEFARMHRLQGEPEKALALLSSIQDVLGLTPQIIYLNMLILSDLKDYNGSLPYAEMLLAQEIPMYRILGMQHMAHCLTVLGDYDGALEYLGKADVLIENTGGELYRRTNQLAIYHLMQCKGLDVTGIREALEAWAFKNQNKFFRGLLGPERSPCP